ncbi:MAG TPA: LytTR family DNA-binding domain-containing protein [Cyclobacteriaceae bacterium]|nr:LytTR family DNA-binding domain-containing protein [Cyclobacteriaceae bacterium]
MIRAIIVDDEPLGRQMLSGMLKNFFPGRVEVMDLSNSVADGLASIEKHKPNVVFLDIEMLDGTGFDLIERSGKHLFLVVFVTAFNDYAVQAFKVNAIEYLLKPIKLEELGVTLDKLDQRLLEGIGNWKEDILKKIMAFSPREIPKIGVPTTNGHVFINVDEIIQCEADSNYSIVHLGDKRMVVSRTLKEMEEVLKEYRFFRIHKSHLINLNKVIKYSKADGGTVSLTNHLNVPVGRHAKDELEKLLRLL